MNTPSFAKAAEHGHSRPGTPISDIPSLLNLPSALTNSSEYPLHFTKSSRKRLVYVYELPDLTAQLPEPATQNPTPQPPDEPEHITTIDQGIPFTSPLRLQAAHHIEPAPGVHV